MVPALLSWLRPAGAPIPELEAQLAAAKAALQEAEQAELAFVDSDGGRKAEDAAVKATEQRQRAELQVYRAQTLLGEALRRDAKAERAAKEQRIRELDARLGRAAVLSAGAELARREAELLEAVAKVRVQRHNLQKSLTSLQHERFFLRQQLGQVTEGHAMGLFDLSGVSEATSPDPVLEMLDRATDAAPPGVLREMLIEVRPSRRTYDLGRSRAFERVNEPKSDQPRFYPDLNRGKGDGPQVA